MSLDIEILILLRILDTEWRKILVVSLLMYLRIHFVSPNSNHAKCIDKLMKFSRMIITRHPALSPSTSRQSILYEAKLLPM